MISDIIVIVWYVYIIIYTIYIYIYYMVLWIWPKHGVPKSPRKFFMLPLDSRHSYLSLIFEAHGQHTEIELPCQGLRSWPSGILQAGCIKGVMAIPSWFKIHPNGTPAVLDLIVLILGPMQHGDSWKGFVIKEINPDFGIFRMWSHFCSHRLSSSYMGFMMIYDDLWWFMMVYVGRGSPTIIFLGISNMKDITDMPTPALRP